MLILLNNSIDSFNISNLGSILHFALSFVLLVRDHREQRLVELQGERAFVRVFRLGKAHDEATLIANLLLTSVATEVAFTWRRTI